jgi:hypothetical protein
MNINKIRSICNIKETFEIPKIEVVYTTERVLGILHRTCRALQEFQKYLPYQLKCHFDGDVDTRLLIKVAA